MSFSSFAKKAAPWITTAVGLAVPGAAPIANIASKLLSAGLNKTVAGDTTSISNAISEAMATPEQLAILKQIDDQFALQMKTLDIQSLEDLQKIGADDRASAREMQVQTKSRTPTMLAWAAVITLVGCIYMLGFRTLPTAGHDALMLLLGAVIATYKDVYGYFFGSSSGSDRKTELLADSPAVQR